VAAKRSWLSGNGTNDRASSAYPSTTQRSRRIIPAPVGAGLPFADDFNAGLSGTNWINKSNWTISVSSGELRATAAGTNARGTIINTGAAVPLVADVQASCSIFDQASAFSAGGPIIRHDGNTFTTAHYIGLEPDLAGTYNAVEWNANASTALGGYNASGASPGDTIGIAAAGTSVYILLNGAVVAGPFTTTVTAAGETGLAILATALSGAGSTDNFTADNFVASGGNVPASITEPASGLDAPDAMQLAVAAILEAATALDAPNATTTTGAAITEPASAQDAPNAVITTSASITEPAAAGDSPNATQLAVASITEPANATDASTNTLIAVADKTEAANATDAPDATILTGGGTVTAAITEAADAQQLTSATVLAVAAISEPASAADSPSATALIGASLTEPASAADTPDATATRPASATEAAAGADAPNAAILTSSAVLEPAGALDTVDAVIIPPGVNVPAAIAEAAAASDAADATILAPQPGAGGGGWQVRTPLFQPALGFTVAAATLERARAIDAPDATVLRATRSPVPPGTIDYRSTRRPDQAATLGDNEIMELVALLEALDIA
jgi:hypothetical protein